MQGSQPVPILVLARLARPLRMCLCGRTRCDSTFHSRLGLGKPPLNASRKLGDDNAWPIRVLAVYAPRNSK